MADTTSGPSPARSEEDDWRGWHRTGVVEVAPEVFRMPLPLPMDGLRAVNVYALRARDGVTLVDAGWAMHGGEEALEQALGQIGETLGDIREFLVTHIHRDHYTLAAAVRRRLGTRVRLGAAEQANMAVVTHRPRTVRSSQVDALRRCGARNLAERAGAFSSPTDPQTWTPPDVWLEDDVHLSAGGRTLRVVHTPGHTRGHVVFHDVDHDLLFSGDHVLPHITPSIGFEPHPPSSPLRDYLTSLHLVRAMPDARLLPGHGPVGQSVHARVDELLSHHDDRLDATLEAVRRGAATAYQVSRRLTWTGRGRRVDDLDDFNAMLAVLETHWHLEVLAERGLVARSEDEEGVLLYEPGGGGARGPT